MRSILAVIFLALLTACAAVRTMPPENTTIFHFQPGAVYQVIFSERLEHRPRSAAEPATARNTAVHFTLKVVAVDAAGRAHLHLEPAQSQVSVQTSDHRPEIHEGWLDRGRDPFDYSPGVRYLRNIGDDGLHLVVAANGEWLRDWRGGRPPADFLTRETWKDAPDNLTLYPQKEWTALRPVLFFVYPPMDWRTAKSWESRFDLTPHPPIIGKIPIAFDISITKREGSLLTLEGKGRAVGKISTKSPFGLVQLGDLTHDMRFTKADYRCRFDLKTGMPLESRVEFHWATQRVVDGLGEVISDDSQILTFQIRNR